MTSHLVLAMKTFINRRFPCPFAPDILTLAMLSANLISIALLYRGSPSESASILSYSSTQTRRRRMVRFVWDHLPCHTVGHRSHPLKLMFLTTDSLIPRNPPDFRCASGRTSQQDMSR